MTKWVTKTGPQNTVLLSEKYADGKEKFDDGPKMVPGEVKAEMRARLLGSQLAEGESVVVSDEEYDPAKEIVDEEWGYINVPMPYTPPDTSNDPVLGKWQYALCIDDGTIVEGPYQAEYDWEWAMWKGGVAATQRDSYNVNHDPDAHIVWGTDE